VKLSVQLSSFWASLVAGNLRGGGGGGGAPGTGGNASAEAVAETTGDVLEVAHAAGTGGLPSLGLLAPVDCGLIVRFQWS